MSYEYEYYSHNDIFVKVRKDLKGKHREYCLCQDCKLFKPGEDDNCTIANLLYSLCVQCGLVTPVWECPIFLRSDIE